ncbi:serine/threonine protein kinase with WD-40 repeats [Calothrix sp. NIES-4071]|nr:serine/threonine protein kinase with WD-40 repeats [Calothrix sp. NIES-4071]BAZ62064.1 serine/threonine protein kinase with WD-40 repeats [Calothrix sp. NIES-4105]
MLDKTAISLLALIAVTCAGVPTISQASKIVLPKVSKISLNSSYSLRVHIWDVTSIAFTSDGKTLVSGSLDETIQVWNLPKRALVRSLPGNKEGVNAVAITLDGLTLASAGGSANSNADKTIRITNLKTGKVIHTLTGHTLGITSLTISPDSKTLVSGSYDKTIKLWNLNTGQLINTLTGHGAWVRAVAISPDGKTLVSAGGAVNTNTDTTIRVWDLPTGKLIRSITGNTNPVSFIGFTPDGQTIVSGDETAVKSWNVSKGELINTINSPSVEGIKAIAISPDGSTVATTSLDASVQLWNLASGKLVRTLVPAANNQNLDRIYPSSVCFSPDGKTIAIGHGGGAYNSQFSIDVQPLY